MRTITEENFTKEVAEKWLTKQVRAINKLKHTGYHVVDKDGTEKYLVENLSTYDKIHIFTIELLTLLAQFTDKRISIDTTWGESSSKCYFMYKGIEVFCLIDKEE